MVPQKAVFKGGDDLLSLSLFFGWGRQPHFWWPCFGMAGGEKKGGIIFIAVFVRIDFIRTCIK